MLQSPTHTNLCQREYGALAQLYADTQTRCSAHILRLNAALLQLRAQAIVQTSALAWAQEDNRALRAERDALLDLHALSTRAADLLICQTGCVTQQDHWRQDDSCKRTGQTCVLAVQPAALELLHPPRAGTVAAATNADADADAQAHPASAGATLP